MANLRWDVLERLWQMVGGCQLPSTFGLRVARQRFGFIVEKRTPLMDL